MGSWKNHVRAQLLHRDQAEKVPYAGVFTSLSLLEERFEIRQRFLEDVHAESLKRGEKAAGAHERHLRLQLRETEHLADKLSQTVSDLTTVLHLKEAEVQYWRSRASHHQQEALNSAKGSKTLKETLSEYEFTFECQAKELAGLQMEKKGLDDSLQQALRDQEGLLQRWMEEKRDEADRLNKYNDTQERWQHLVKQLKKHLQRESKKCSDSFAAEPWISTPENQSFLSPQQTEFAHPERNETRTHKTSTSTGEMLSQVKSLPEALSFECDPKWKSKQNSVMYPYSDHDNKYALKQNILVFNNGVGRRKCLDERRHHNSHFCLSHSGADISTEETAIHLSAYQTDFVVRQADNVQPRTRRFPRNHKKKCVEAALEMAGDQFMWFGKI